MTRTVVLQKAASNATITARVITLYSRPKPRRPRLPVEVYERIIDDLSGDGKTLHSCALTCQAWLPRARYRLYIRVQLVSVFMVARFLDTILHICPANATLVRCLSIGPHVTRTRDVQEVNHLVMTAVLRLAPHLSSLQELCILECPLQIHSTFLPLLGQFNSVTRVSLEWTQFKSFSQFKRHVLTFRALKSLRLFNVSWKMRRQLVISKPGRETSRFNLKGPALEYVQLHCHDDSEGVVEDTIRWLLTSPTVSSLTTLSVWPIVTAAEVHAFKLLILTCRQTLRTLEIICADPWGEPADFGGINLHESHALEDLRMRHVHVSRLPEVVAFLQHVPPSLRVLSLQFAGTRAEMLSAPAWTDLNATLNARLVALKRLAVGLIVPQCEGGPPMLQISEKEVRAIFHDSHARRILLPYSEDGVFARFRDV
ncbi:hypothetical protein EIP91_001286 [Steccherinum ochraceum]|uniref:F-box domain-containing protein n=1 Tax=Steccherinum ochraceum TaxID=92696 RepID=A0A4R0REA4_9APHY|nr:hypothetical protein EIP91_001286 [Steccherinum ochraceum]